MPDPTRHDVYSEDGKLVGYVEGDIFYKHVKKSIHFLHTPPAIATDTVALMRARELGARYVYVVEAEENITYKAPMTIVFSEGRPIDRGFGRQIALGLPLWKTGDEPFVEQLELF